MSSPHQMLLVVNLKMITNLGVFNLLWTGYITTVLEDAVVYSKHAGKKELDADDVQLAIQSRLDHSYTNPPPREVLYTSYFLCHQSSLWLGLGVGNLLESSNIHQSLTYSIKQLEVYCFTAPPGWNASPTEDLQQEVTSSIDYHS